jgi:hypothetical protein
MRTLGSVVNIFPALLYLTVENSFWPAAQTTEKYYKF